MTQEYTNILYLLEELDEDLGRQDTRPFCERFLRAYLKDILDEADTLHDLNTAELLLRKLGPKRFLPILDEDARPKILEEYPTLQAVAELLDVYYHLRTLEFKPQPDIITKDEDRRSPGFSGPPKVRRGGDTALA